MYSWASIDSSELGADSLNAAFLFTDVGEKLISLENDIFVGRQLANLHATRDSALIRSFTKWADENKDLLPIIEKATQLPVCDFSRISNYYPSFNLASKQAMYFQKFVFLLLSNAWQYNEESKFDSALVMYESIFGILREFDTQQEQQYLSKLMEMMTISNVTQALYHQIRGIEHQNIEYFQALYFIVLSYLESRKSLEPSMYDECFQKIDFQSMASRFSADLLTRIPDLSETDLERFINLASMSAEKRYLEYTGQYYESVLRAFRRNKPSLADLSTKLDKYSVQIQSLPLSVAIHLGNFEGAAIRIGRLTGFTIGAVTKFDFSEAISAYYINDAELRLILLLLDFKINDHYDLTMDLNNVYTDAFNSFRPLRVLESQEGEVRVYSYGPDKSDGHGKNLLFSVENIEQLEDYDIGFEL